MNNIRCGYLLLFAGLIFAAGCGDVGTSGGKTLSGLAVTPTTATFKVGSAESFASIASYSDGSTAGVSASWSVSGLIGTVTLIGLDAQVIATHEGSGTLTATYSGFSASASLTITASTGVSTLTTIEVTPGTATILVSRSQTFTASGKGATGEAMTIAPTWLISGDAVGAFTFTGTTATVEASSEGTATVTCVSGEVSRTATLTVEGFIGLITADANTYVDYVTAEGIFWNAATLKAGQLAATSTYETYFLFPLPAGTVSIECASLEMNVSQVSAASNVIVAPLAATFDASTKWSNKPAITQGYSTTSFSAGKGVVDITSLAKTWLTANPGLLALYSNTVTTDNIIYISGLVDATETNRPKLYLQYKTH